MKKNIQNWHKAIKNGDLTLLDAILSESVVFHSPILHKPQVGKKLAFMYLSAAYKVLLNDSFKYVKETSNDTQAILEFETEIDRIYINGVDIITFNTEGKIIDFKVMLRPLKAIELVGGKMMEMLQKLG